MILSESKIIESHSIQIVHKFKPIHAVHRFSLILLQMKVYPLIFIFIGLNVIIVLLLMNTGKSTTRFIHRMETPTSEITTKVTSGMIANTTSEMIANTTSGITANTTAVVNEIRLTMNSTTTSPPVMKKKFYIAGEGIGMYSNGAIDVIIMQAFLEYEVVWTSDHNVNRPNLAIRSFYTSSPFSCPYIVWSGEDSRPPLRTANDPFPTPLLQIFDFETQINAPDEFFIPFFVFVLSYENRNSVPFDHFSNRHPPSYKRPYFLAYAATNCVMFRETIFAALRSRSSSAHGLGSCSGTPGMIVQNGFNGNFINFRSYRFALVMEHNDFSGYITEKIVTAFMAGCIPIYWGSKGKIKEFFNPKAFIYVEDFKVVEDLVNHVMNIEQNEALYNEMTSQPLFLNGVPSPMDIVLNSPYVRSMAATLRKNYEKSGAALP